MPQVNEFSWSKSSFFITVLLLVYWLKFSPFLNCNISISSIKVNKFSFLMLV